MTVETPEQRARRLFEQIQEAAEAHADGDELAKRRMDQQSKALVTEPPEVVDHLKAMLGQGMENARAQVAEQQDRAKAGEEFGRIWQEKYPDAKTMGEVVLRAREDGLDLEALADKALSEDIVREVMGDPLAPLDTLAQESAVISMTVACSTNGVAHNVEVHAVHRDGERVYRWVVNQIEGDEGDEEMYGGLGSAGTPGAPLRTPREAFEAAMQALVNAGGPAALLKPPSKPIPETDLDDFLKPF